MRVEVANISYNAGTFYELGCAPRRAAPRRPASPPSPCSYQYMQTTLVAVNSQMNSLAGASWDGFLVDDVEVPALRRPPPPARVSDALPVAVVRAHDRDARRLLRQHRSGAAPPPGRAARLTPVQNIAVHISDPSLLLYYGVGDTSAYFNYFHTLRASSNFNVKAMELDSTVLLQQAPATLQVCAPSPAGRSRLTPPQAFANLAAQRGTQLELYLVRRGPRGAPRVA
jgi:hypothetical protein